MLQSSNMFEASVPSEHHWPSHGTRDFIAFGFLLRQFQYLQYSTILALRVNHFALSNRPWLLSLSLQRSLASTLLSYTAVMIAAVILRHFMEFEDSFERILKDLTCNAGNVCRRISQGPLLQSLPLFEVCGWWRWFCSSFRCLCFQRLVNL